MKENLEQEVEGWSKDGGTGEAGMQVLVKAWLDSELHQVTHTLKHWAHTFIMELRCNGGLLD